MIELGEYEGVCAEEEIETAEAKAYEDREGEDDGGEDEEFYRTDDGMLEVLC